MKKYFFLFVISLIIFFFHSVITKQGLYGDGNGYYSYTNSLYFQGNLNFDPIYYHLENFNGTKFIFSRVFWNTNFTKTGNIHQNPYMIGTGLSWIPSMLAVSAINKLFSLGANRFSLIYELGPGISGIVFIIAGLYFLEKYLLNFFSKQSVFWTILTIFFASNIFYFTAFEPALSHQPSFFIISFLLFWTYKFKSTAKNIFIFGLFTGFLATIRIADVILLIPIFFQVIKYISNLKHLPYYILGFLITISPQVIIQYLMYGNIFSNPYLTGQSGTWQFSLVHFSEYLFSPMRGLFAWSPLFLLGVWGLIKNKSWLFITTSLFLWLVTSSWSAYLSAGFGQRFSFSAIPMFAYGFAFLINKWKFKKIFIVCLIFSFLNLNLLSTFYLHKDKLLEAGSVSWKDFIGLQINNPFQVFGLLSTKIML